MSASPEWVKALNEAKDVLARASQADPSDMDAITRLAYAWLDVAKLYKS